jgi:ferredoxin
MKNYYLSENYFFEFISKIINQKELIAPVAKGPKFVFSKINDPTEIRLDYDLTILPPKKIFFPPSQNLLKFKAGSYEGCINPADKILLGVHPYDIKGIDITDQLFEQNKKDMNYLANRNATTIVGSNIQTISKRAFWDSVGTEISPKGHDAFLTKITGGYHFQTLSKKGDDLLSFGNFSEATDKQTAEAKKNNNSKEGKCPEKLKHSSTEIAKKVRNSFKNTKMWTKMAEKCFSCGTCNTVCPTCYCFDVQDKWNLNQVSGVRTRYWDACLTEDFAKISLGGDNAENFRESRGERFRHRIMRKSTYLNETLGTPACVGCGRCSSSCTANIADPVETINSIMEENHV